MNLLLIRGDIIIESFLFHIKMYNRIDCLNSGAEQPNERQPTPYYIIETKLVNLYGIAFTGKVFLARVIISRISKRE